MGWFTKKTPAEKRKATVKAKVSAQKRAQNRTKLKQWVKQGKEAVQKTQQFFDEADKNETARLKEKTAKFKARTEYERARQSYEQARGGGIGSSYGGSQGFGQYSSASAPSSFVFGQGFQDRPAPTPVSKPMRRKRRKKSKKR